MAAEYSGTLLGGRVPGLQPSGCWSGSGHVLPGGGSNIPPGGDWAGDPFPQAVHGQ